MQFLTTILAFATAAMAVPAHSQCTFGHKCSNIGTTPYCQAVPKTKRAGAPPACSAPGT
ncbi:hypothetical protein DHEL01_v211323 [Diaporthe helianthi]|uniref:Uncharacterized protein n=1 Tax=Diaporthe helianthi TaxID=158607 RepID=A0A2P5HJ90_DIAHE|nr:hypothetical protein DHEL01_v211323 [Diaporthe helianthi]